MIAVENAHAKPPLEGVPAPELGSRALFPSLEFEAYLAHAAISPANLAVQRAVASCTESVAQLGTGAFPLWMAQRQRLRELVARLLNAASSDVTLSPGCTRGIADVALALPWRRGETLLSFVGEFPANIVPFQQAKDLYKGGLRLLPLADPRDADARTKLVAQVREAIQTAPATSPVRYLAVSAVQFQSGLAMPLADLSQLCQEHGVFLLVDAIQGCGVVPYDLHSLEIDAFFVGAHKWLLGLEGAGFFVTRAEFRERLRPRTAGWLSYQDSELFLFSGAGHLRYDRPLLDDGRMFEGSTANAAGFAALEAGLAICEKLGPQAIFGHVQRYHDAIEPELADRGFVSLRAVDPSLRSCSLSFVPPMDVEVGALAKELRQRKVMISIPDGLVRIAPHFSNSLGEVPGLLAAFDEALSALRG